MIKPEADPEELRQAKASATDLNVRLVDATAEVERLRGDLALVLSWRRAAATIADTVRDPKMRDQACFDSHACNLAGACGHDRRYNGCVATKDEHCERSHACGLLGRCSLADEGSELACAPASDRDCLASEMCKTAGLCRAVNGSCVQ